MKITFDEIMSKKEWLHKELLKSLNGLVITQASHDQFLDVKLLVNGTELEPQLYNALVNNIKKYINAKAKNLVKLKLKEAEDKTKILSRLVETVVDNIANEFNLDKEDFKL